MSRLIMAVTSAAGRATGRAPRAYLTMSVPRTMPIPQLKVNEPAFDGVNSTVTGSFSGKSRLIR